MPANLSGAYSASYPSDVRSSVGVGINKVGLSLKIFLDYTNVELKDKLFSSGWVVVQDPITKIFTRYNLENLETDPLDGSVTNVKFAAAPAFTVKGNLTDTLGGVQDIQLTDLIQSGNPVGDALETKATKVALAAAEARLDASIATKATPADISAAIDPVEDRISIVEIGQKSNRITRALYSDFAALTLDANSTYESREKTGTHPGVASEVGYFDGQVPNGGLFIPQGSPLALRRIDDTGTPGFTATPVVSAIADTDTLLVLTADGNPNGRFTGASLKSLIQEIAVPPLYATDLTNVVVTDQSTIILGADASRRGDLLIQLLDDADIGLNFSDRPAVFGQQGTWPQKAGQWVNHGFVGTKAVAAIARGPNNTAYAGPVKLNVRVQRTVDGDLPSTIADNIFAHWPDAADQRYKDVIRQEVDYLVRQGIYQKLTMWWMPGASRENNRVNLANPNAPLFTYQNGTNGIEVAPYKYMKSSGNDAYVSTGLTAAQMGMTVNDHFMTSKIYPGGGVQADGYSMGSSINLFNQPNRAANLHGFRSGGATDTYAGGTDLSTSLSRFNSATEFGVFVDGARIATKARALDILPDRTFNLLGVNASAGYGFVSTLPLQFAGAGPGLQDVSVNRFNDSCKRIAAVCAQITGA